jgi:hypothetical protein
LDAVLSAVETAALSVLSLVTALLVTALPVTALPMVAALAPPTVVATPRVVALEAPPPIEVAVESAAVVVLAPALVAESGGLLSELQAKVTLPRVSARANRRWVVSWRIRAPGSK